MATFTQYKGSPDIFKKDTGQRITEQEAQTAGLFTPQGLSPEVEQMQTTRPDITQESQFAQKAGLDIPTVPFSLPPVTPEATSATLTQPKVDYQPLLDEQKKFREQYLKSLQPTVAETDINKQIADIRGQAEQQKLAAQKEQVGIEQAGMQRGGETKFVRGEQALAGKQRELEYQTLASQEANLLSRLGLEQESRKAQQQALATGMSFIQQDIETQQKIQERLQAEEDRVLARANTLRDDARAVLSTILTQFKGMDISDLSPEVQSQLAQTATKAGIPLDVLVSGMKNIKDQQDFANSMKTAEFGLKEEAMSLREQLAQAKLDAAQASGMSPTTQTKVLQVAGQFDNEAVVKQYNIIKEGKQFVDNISNDTKNPADQQGIIYAFAKAMDPNSVVREGEYATVQKYAQSWANTFGFNAERIFSNSPFLTKEAIVNMKKTIDSKASASEKTYKNVYNEYTRRINKVGNINDGADYLTDYSKGYGEIITPGTDEDIINKIMSGDTSVINLPETPKVEEKRGFWNDFLGAFGLQTK